MDNQEALNDQPGHVIERMDSVPKLYYSAEVGRSLASPTGGWSQEFEQASLMTEAAANHLLDTVLIHQAPSCKVVKYG
jgi:hypothetical protein